MKKVRTPYPEVLKALEKKFKGNIKHTGTYLGAWSPTTFKCLTCGREGTSTFAEKLKSRLGCSACARQGVGSYSHEEFMEVFRSKHTNGNLKILGKYTKSGPIETKCLDCGLVWKPKSGNLLNANSGCPECAKFKTNRFDFKDYKLHKRIVRVQGSEDKALDWLINVKKTEPKKIQVYSDRTIPEIRYKFKGRWRHYRPDIQVGKTLYEVKSLWTLTCDFPMNVAKALACIEQGYRHKLLLVGQETTLQLPDTWVKKKPAFIDLWFRVKTQRPLTVLALDPGTSNFGWSILYATSPSDIQVRETGMLTSTLTDLKTDVTSQMALFSRELASLVRNQGVNAIAVERFMARGMKGATIEFVNMMIGATVSQLSNGKRKLLVMPASQWKNEFNRHSSLEKFYELAKGCSVHQLDSVGIGVYGIYHWFGKKAFVDFDKSIKSLAKQAVLNNREAK